MAKELEAFSVKEDAMILKKYRNHSDSCVVIETNGKTRLIKNTIACMQEAVGGRIELVPNKSGWFVDDSVKNYEKVKNKSFFFDYNIYCDEEGMFLKMPRNIAADIVLEALGYGQRSPLRCVYGPVVIAPSEEKGHPNSLSVKELDAFKVGCKVICEESDTAVKRAMKAMVGILNEEHRSSKMKEKQSDNSNNS